VYSSAGGGCCSFMIAIAALVVAVLAFQMAKENRDFLQLQYPVTFSAGPASAAAAGYLWRYLLTGFLALYLASSGGSGSGK